MGSTSAPSISYLPPRADTIDDAIAHRNNVAFSITDGFRDPVFKHYSEPLCDTVIHPNADAEQQCDRNTNAHHEWHVHPKSDDLYEPVWFTVTDAVEVADTHRFAEPVWLIVTDADTHRFAIAESEWLYDSLGVGDAKPDPECVEHDIGFAL